MTSAAGQLVFDQPWPPGGLVDQVARILADFADQTPVPGLAVSVFDDTAVLAEMGLGTRALDNPADVMTEHTLFRLSSLTKMFTALTAMRLADAGRLALHEPLSELFPASAELQAPISAVTVRQLLSHTSGLTRGELDLDVGGRDSHGLAEYVLHTGIHTPFIADPGIVYSYSDQGFSLVGYIIERVTGRCFATAVRELVFEPLGMRSACFDPLVAMTYPLSQQHVHYKSRGLVQEHRFAEATRIHPCAGAFCSVHELALFGMLHLSNGLAAGTANRVISASALREIRSPRTDIGLDVDLRYGLGAYAGPRYGGHPAYGHEGYFFGTWSKLILIPGLRLGIAWCDNCGAIPALVARRYRAINEIVASLRAAEPSWCLPEAVGSGDDSKWRERCVGRYRRFTGRPVEVFVDDDALLISDGRVTVPLVHHHESVFVAQPATRVPSRPPWEPHTGSTRCCVRFVGHPTERIAYLTLNGIAYRRF
jgi:CubicO group peptidase (beta-lactamase class C family)